MIYLKEHKSNKNKKIVTLFVVIVFVIFALIQIFLPHLLSAIFTTIASPFWKVGFSIESGSLLSREDLLRKNEELKIKLEEALARIDSVSYLESENQELRRILDSTSASSSYTLSAVIKKPPFVPYDEYIIDIGKNKGLSTTSVIYSIGDVPIGKVEEVLSDLSRVVLFSSFGQKQEVLIGEQNIPSVAIGKGGGQYEVELPKGLNIKEGDFVLSATYKGRPMGKVVSIDSDNALPFQKVYFSVPVNIYQLRWVLVDK